MQDLANIFIKSIFIDNMVFAYFLGMCSYLAISKTVKTSVGMGLAVIFVLFISVPINYLLVEYVLEKGALVWLGEEFKDMEDCILYETELINSTYKLKEKENLIKKLKLVINDQNLQNKIYKNYFMKIKENHTRFARANYIVNTIQKNLI